MPVALSLRQEVSYVQKWIFILAVFFGSASLQAQTAGSTGPTPPSATPPPAPTQPIPFNHKLHIQSAKMACTDCHEPRGNGATVAMPQPPKCMLCHAAIATDKPDIQRLAAAAKHEETIAWVRVYRVPSFVTFSHQTHTTAGNTCEECHGPVAERTAIALEKPTSMAACIACHQAKQAPATCDTCHAAMSQNSRPPGHAPFDRDAPTLALLHRPAVNAAQPQQSTQRQKYQTPQLAVMHSFLHAPLL